MRSCAILIIISMMKAIKNNHPIHIATIMDIHMDLDMVVASTQSLKNLNHQII